MNFIEKILKPFNKYKILIEDKIKNSLVRRSEFYLINNSKDKYFMGFEKAKVTTGMRLRINGKWEPHCSSAIRSLMKENDNVLQLGAAWGYFTLLMKTIQNDSAYIYAIEADKDRCDQLTRNFEKNKFKNWEVINSFISKDSNHLSFQKLFQSLNKKIDFLFADIEGYELDVLDEIIENNIKIRNMVIGFHTIDLRSSEKNLYKESKFYSYDDLENRLNRLKKNYEFRIDEDNILFFLKSS